MTVRSGRRQTRLMIPCFAASSGRTPAARVIQVRDRVPIRRGAGRARSRASARASLCQRTDCYTTANHVVEGADQVKVSLTDGGKEFTGKVIGTDPATDVAVLKIDAKDLPAITMTDSDKLEVGDVVLAVGNLRCGCQTLTSSGLSAAWAAPSSLGVNDYEDFHPDRCRHQPGQFRRAARGCRRGGWSASTP